MDIKEAYNSSIPPGLALKLFWWTVLFQSAACAIIHQKSIKQAITQGGAGSQSGKNDVQIRVQFRNARNRSEL